MVMEPLFEQGKEAYSKKNIVLENSLIILNILLGSFGMAPVKWMSVPVLSILYFLFIVYMLTFALRKHLCTQCWYYGKNCHCGWGKLALTFYDKGVGNRKLGGILAGITWSVLMVLPLIVMGYLLYTRFSLPLLGLFLAFILVTVINNIFHVKDCRECKMKFICPGSAAKSI